MFGERGVDDGRLLHAPQREQAVGHAQPRSRWSGSLQSAAAYSASALLEAGFGEGLLGLRARLGDVVLGSPPHCKGAPPVRQEPAASTCAPDWNRREWLMSAECTSCGHVIPAGQFRCGKCGGLAPRESLEDFAGLTELVPRPRPHLLPAPADAAHALSFELPAPPPAPAPARASRASWRSPRRRRVRRRRRRRRSPRVPSPPRRPPCLLPTPAPRRARASPGAPLCATRTRPDRRRQERCPDRLPAHQDGAPAAAPAFPGLGDSARGSRRPVSRARRRCPSPFRWPASPAAWRSCWSATPVRWASLCAGLPRHRGAGPRAAQLHGPRSSLAAGQVSAWSP